jgi:urease accessory protein
MSHHSIASSRLQRLLRALVPLLALALPSLCFAHSQNDGEGFMAGFLHPVFGFDHLLAMVSVGIVSAQLGGANIWRVPAAFVSSMVLGGLLGIFQHELPMRELGIAASVIFLGVAIIHVNAKTSPWIPFAFVLFFGICHGHAHGTEMPGSASPAFYTLGFLLSTSLLHLVGVGIGELAIRREKLVSGLRYVGAAMAGVGLTFLLSGFGVSVV